jgi:hypothetical protein
LKNVIIVFSLVVVAAAGIYLYRLPVVNEKLGWRIESLRADVKYALNPPEEVIFQPKSASSGLLTPVPTAEITRTPTPTIDLTRNIPTETAFPTATVTPTPTPVPDNAKLDGFVHNYQMWNNCGPANLAMSLSYWGWEGDQRVTAEFLKPNERDKNVMPYEMVDYVETQTDLNAISRAGGDPDLLKAFISAGFPVIVEKGFEGPEFEGWMGHYSVVNGYNDAEQVFYTQDSYKGPDYKISYEDMEESWRAFNNNFVVVYPAEKDAQVLDILDLHANAHFNYLEASQKATEEINSLSGRDLFFAYYNLGTNLVFLNDYTNAAVAYDAAFANYPEIPESDRPWRMIWYQTGPYFAYYYTGRYEDVINLADTTLNAMSEPVLEESYYWRAKAKLGLGDEEGAIEDFRKSLEMHPEFGPSVEELSRLGVTPE